MGWIANSTIANIKKIYNFKYIKVKDEKVEIFCDVGQRIRPHSNSVQSLKINVLLHY